MKTKKGNKLMRIVLIVNLVMAVILISSISYAYYVTKETIADNAITIGTVGVKGVVDNLKVTPEFTVDGGSATITNGSIVVSNATPNTQFTFNLTLNNTSTLNNCYNIIFNSAVASVVDSFSLTAAKAGGTPADNLSFSSLSGRKESNFVVWDASPTDKTRTYNFTLTTGNNPVSGAFNIDIISTQKSAVKYVSDLAALTNTPSGGWAVLSQDIGTAVAPVAAIALTKPLNIDLNGYALYTQGFSMVDSNASGAYTIKNGKVVTTVDGVVVNLPLATLNIADSVFQVPAGKNITITGAPHTVNLSGATSFQRKSGDVYLDIAADIAADTRIIITRSVSKAIGLNVVGGGVVVVNESYAEGAITIAAAVAAPVTIENNGALASITNNATSEAAIVAITNNTKATLASVVVSANVTAKVDIVNEGIVGTVNASNTTELNVVNSNGGSVTTTSGTNPNNTVKSGVTTSVELQTALNSSQPIIYVAKDINNYTEYTVNHNVKLIGMITPPDPQTGSGIARHISGTITCTTAGTGATVATLTEEFVSFRGIAQADINSNLTVEVGNISATHGESHITMPVVTQVFSNGVQLTKAQMLNYDIKIYCSNFVEAQDKLSKTLKFMESPTHYLENATLVDPVANPTIAGTLVGAVANKTNYTVQADGSILVTYHQTLAKARYYLVLSEKGTNKVRLVSSNIQVTDFWTGMTDYTSSDYLEFSQKMIN